MMTPTNQHISNGRQFSCDKLCYNLLSRVSLLLHTRQKGLLTVVMVKIQDYPKLLNRSTSNFFLVTFVQLWWFSIVMDTVYVNFLSVDYSGLHFRIQKRENILSEG